MPIPPTIYRYFWDVDTGALDAERDERYITERLLERGDLDAARWLLRTYPREHLAHTVKTSRQLSPKSRNFWMIWLTPPVDA